MHLLNFMPALRLDGAHQCLRLGCQAVIRGEHKKRCLRESSRLVFES